MEEKYMVPQFDEERYSSFIVIHIALCLLVFFYAKDVIKFYNTGLGLLGFIDSIFAAIEHVSYFIAMIVWSVFLLIPFRFITVKKNTLIMEDEVRKTFKSIGVGVALSLAAGVLFMGIRSLWLMCTLFLPVLLFEITVYWLGLFNTWKRNQFKTLQVISLRNTGKTIKDDYKEVNQMTRVSDVMRFVFFIVVHLILCTAVFISIKYRNFGSSYVYSGISYVYFGPSDILYGSALLLTLFRLIAVRESARVTDFEAKGTLAVMAAGVVLSLTAGVFFMETVDLWFMGVSFLPVLILEITVYWSVLWEQISPRDKKISDTLRFMNFIVIHVVLCVSVFFCAKAAMPIIFHSDFYMLTSTLSVVMMSVRSLALLTPLRFIAIKEDTWITEVEAGRTLKVIIAGGVLSLAAGVLFMGIKILLSMIILFLPVFYLEIIVYWFGLLERKIVRYIDITL